MLALGWALTPSLQPATSPTSRSQQLTVLRDIAKVKATLAQVQGAWSPDVPNSPEVLSSIYSTLQMETNALVSDMRSFERTLSPPPVRPRPPSSIWLRGTSSRYQRELQELRVKASKLHDQVDKQREQLALLEEAEESAESRARQVFDILDINGDGTICLKEFKDAVSYIAHTPCLCLAHDAI